MTESAEIDWDELRDRLAALSPERAERARAAEAVRRRTRALAAPLRALVDTGQGRLLVFRRGTERFGIALEGVAATFTATSVTPVPGADAPVRGVVAWRGRPLAVYDIAAATTPLPEPATLVVVGGWHRAVAVLADELEDVISYEAPAAGTESSPSRFVRSVTADAIAVVDPDAILTLFADTR